VAGGLNTILRNRKTVANRKRATRRRKDTEFVHIGFFAVVLVAVAFAVFYVFVNFAGQDRYRIGVRFARAAGVSQGSQVFFSGVEVGTVDEIRLLPDGTVDLILGFRNSIDIPKSAKFAIKPTLTGSPTVVITPPVAQAQLKTLPTRLPPEALLQKRILPLAEQPIGSDPIGLEDLLGQSQQLMHRSKAILSEAQGYRGRLSGKLQRAREGANASYAELHSGVADAMSGMQTTLKVVQANVTQAQSALRDGNGPKMAAIASSLRGAATSLNATASAFRLTARQPQVMSNLRESAGQIDITMSNLSALKDRMKDMSADNRTRLQLADAAAQLRAALERLSSLLKGP